MNQLAQPQPFQTQPGLTLHAMRPAPTRNSAPRAQRRLGTALHRWWQRLWMDDRTAYLSQAEDAVDLENRLRNWNEFSRGVWPLVR